DSFYLGEDGPTHQAVEHTMSLRLIPSFYVMRPADAFETECMMVEALHRQAPSALALSRQNLPILNLSDDIRQNCKRGGYIVHQGAKPEYIIFATGSEVALALETLPLIGRDKVVVVSLPCWEIFFEQD